MIVMTKELALQIISNPGGYTLQEKQQAIAYLANFSLMER